LRRRSDGQIYRNPNPAPATWGSGAPPAPDDWVRGFLAFYDLAPPANDGDPGCIFNSDATTIDAVVATLASQASLAGYDANSNAKTIATKVMADRKAIKAAQDIADRITAKVAGTGDMRGEVATLSHMGMRALLDVLTKLYQTRVLEAFLNKAPDIGDRVGVAILTVQADFGKPWKTLVAKLSDDDRKAVLERTPSTVKLDGGDDVEPAPSSTSRVAMYLQFSIVDTKHTGGPGGPTSDKVGGQATYLVTLELHPKDKSGLEVSWGFQVTGFPDHGDPKWRVQNIVSGPQVSWVFSFLEGSLQFGPIAQGLVGVSRAPVKDRMILTPTGQVALGGQIQYAIPGFNGHLLIGGQFASSFTDPQGSNATGDLAAQISLIIKF
jgi:hypothetical protein